MTRQEIEHQLLTLSLADKAQIVQGLTKALKMSGKGITKTLAVCGGEACIDGTRIAAITERPFQEVYDDIQIRQKLDGEADLKGKDGGIDGAVFVEQGGYYTLMVFQCKNKPGLKPNELDKFRHDVDDLFIYGISKLNTELLQPKLNEYQQLSKDGFIVEIKYYFVYAGSNQDPNYAANSQSYQAYHKPDEYEIWDAEAIYEKISQLIKAQAKRKDIKFTFNPQTSNIITADRQGQGLYTYSVGNVRAANFRIEADELCRLVEQELSANNTEDLIIYISVLMPTFGRGNS
jgi:hypothetical protein